ncbi:MAG: hypothetical protein ACE5H3_03870 [Planctomycetota bacterium]
MPGPSQPAPPPVSAFTLANPGEPLVRFVDRVRSLVSNGQKLAQRVAGIGAAAELLASSGLELPAGVRHAGDDAYGRNLVYRDPDFGFILVAMVWPAGAESPIHDHGTWCCLGVLEGTVEVAAFERRSGGGIREVARTECGSGTVCSILPPRGDIHRVFNPSETPALTLHTYGTERSHCLVFDPRTGAESPHPLTYCNV